MTKYAVLIHGKDGSPDTSWLPWLSQKLEYQGYQCKSPSFPAKIIYRCESVPKFGALLLSPSKNHGRQPVEDHLQKFVSLDQGLLR